MIGVQLLSQLTCEMNQISEADANRSLTKHRKIASSFRDTQLFEIFRLSCSLLGTARENCKNLNFNDEAQVSYNFFSIKNKILKYCYFIIAWINDTTSKTRTKLFNI
jgi:hypothetical protein